MHIGKENVIPRPVHQETALLWKGEQRLALVAVVGIGAGVITCPIRPRVDANLSNITAEDELGRSAISLSFIALRPFTDDQSAAMK